MCLPFGPTTCSTSASISSCSTPSPTPTLSASRPSFAAPPKLAQRVLHPLRQPLDAALADNLVGLVIYGSHGGPSCLDGLVRTRHAGSGSGRGGRTAVHQVLRATGQPPACWS